MSICKLIFCRFRPPKQGWGQPQGMKRNIQGLAPNSHAAVKQQAKLQKQAQNQPGQARNKQSAQSIAAGIRSGLGVAQSKQLVEQQQQQQAKTQADQTVISTSGVSMDQAVTMAPWATQGFTAQPAAAAVQQQPAVVQQPQAVVQQPQVVVQQSVAATGYQAQPAAIPTLQTGYPIQPLVYQPQTGFPSTQQLGFQSGQPWAQSSQSGFQNANVAAQQTLYQAQQTGYQAAAQAPWNQSGNQAPAESFEDLERQAVEEYVPEANQYRWLRGQSTSAAPSSGTSPVANWKTSPEVVIRSLSKDVSRKNHKK